MTVRERLLAVLRGEKPSAVPWLADLDYWLAYMQRESLLPDRYRGDGLFALHRDIGAGFYLQGYFPFIATYDGVRVTEWEESNRRIRTVETPAGNLREVETYLPDSYCWGYSERCIKSWRDLAALRYWYAHTHYQPDYSRAQRRLELVGDNGIVLCYLPKSPLMEMVALLAGIETVTYALADAAQEFEETLLVLDKAAGAAATLAVQSPAEALMIPENLSSEAVGKSLFQRYMAGYERRWVEEISRAGKFSFVHMDGTLRGLIAEVAATGFTVLEALTPAPVGDVALAELAGLVPPQTVIWGGLPGVYFTDLVSDEQFDRYVIETLSVMRSAPRYVLGVADQVPPRARWQRIQRVSELVEQHGRFE